MNLDDWLSLLKLG